MKLNEYKRCLHYIWYAGKSKWCSCCASPMIMMIRISLMRHIFWVNNELMHSINFLSSSCDHILLITYAWMNLLTKMKKSKEKKMVVGLHCKTCSEVVFAGKWYENENNDDVEADFLEKRNENITDMMLLQVYHHHHNNKVSSSWWRITYTTPERFFLQ